MTVDGKDLPLSQKVWKSRRNFIYFLTILYKFTDKYFGRCWIATSKTNKITSSRLIYWIKYVLIALLWLELITRD